MCSCIYLFCVDFVHHLSFMLFSGRASPFLFCVRLLMSPSPCAARVARARFLYARCLVWCVCLFGLVCVLAWLAGFGLVCLCVGLVWFGLVCLCVGLCCLCCVWPVRVVVSVFWFVLVCVIVLACFVLVGWLVGWLVGRSVGWLVGWLACLFVCLFVCVARFVLFCLFGSLCPFCCVCALCDCVSFAPFRLCLFGLVCLFVRLLARVCFVRVFGRWVCPGWFGLDCFVVFCFVRFDVSVVLCAV